MSQAVGTARRLVFLGSHLVPSLIQEVVAIPKLKAGEILGKLRMATICGSDLHTISGKRKEATPRYVRPYLYGLGYQRQPFFQDNFMELLCEEKNNVRAGRVKVHPG